MVKQAERIRGRKLQARRLRIWSADPHCAMCGKLCAYPAGFELDHIKSLDAKGDDTDENCQVLCVDTDGSAADGGKAGCHRKKTAQDMGYKHVAPPRARFDSSGRVVW